MRSTDGDERKMISRKTIDEKKNFSSEFDENSRHRRCLIGNGMNDNQNRTGNKSMSKCRMSSVLGLLLVQGLQIVNIFLFLEIFNVMKNNLINNNRNQIIDWYIFPSTGRGEEEGRGEKKRREEKRRKSISTHTSIELNKHFSSSLSVDALIGTFYREENSVSRSIWFSSSSHIRKDDRIFAID